MRYRHLLISGMACGLVACNSTKQFTIHTDPEGATVNINGKKQNGCTPMTVTIDQDKDLGIVVRKDGYQSNAKTVGTKTSWLQSILWTSNDPRAQYIEEDEVTIPLTRIAPPVQFKPTVLTPYNNPNIPTPAPSKAPALREMPSDL